jgi:hypothetical protein
LHVRLYTEEYQGCTYTEAEVDSEPPSPEDKELLRFEIPLPPHLVPAFFLVKHLQDEWAGDGFGEPMSWAVGVFWHSEGQKKEDSDAYAMFIAIRKEKKDGRLVPFFSDSAVPVTDDIVSVEGFCNDTDGAFRNFWKLPHNHRVRELLLYLRVEAYKKWLQLSTPAA